MSIYFWIISLYFSTHPFSPDDSCHSKLYVHINMCVCLFALGHVNNLTIVVIIKVERRKSFKIVKFYDSNHMQKSI